MKSAFLRVGHLPTLIACFLYFDASFAIWVLLGPLAVLIAPDLHLNAGDKGLVATPVLAGALLRIVNGVLVGQWNGRSTGIVMQLVVITGLLAAWALAGHSFSPHHAVERLAPPIPGLGLLGVCAFRDIADVDKMLAAARGHKRAVVIGGGLPRRISCGCMPPYYAWSAPPPSRRAAVSNRALGRG